MNVCALECSTGIITITPILLNHPACVARFPWKQGYCYQKQRYSPRANLLSSTGFMPTLVKTSHRKKRKKKINGVILSKAHL